jgi:hypothetical protein
VVMAGVSITLGGLALVRLVSVVVASPLGLVAGLLFDDSVLSLLLRGHCAIRTANSA